MKKNWLKVSERVWGKIHDFEMCFPDIYFVSGSQEGYVVAKAYYGTLLSPKALSFGTEHDGFLFFAVGETMSIIEYELLEHRLKNSSNDEEKEKLQKLMEELRMWGQIDLSGYFGEYTPPGETPAGTVEKLIKVRNGIFFTWVSGQWLLGICRPIWECELSSPANSLGTEKADYMFFDLKTAVIPIFELEPYYAEVRELIASKEALHSLLSRFFFTYLIANNLYKPEQLTTLETKTHEQLIQEFLVFPKVQ